MVSVQKNVLQLLGLLAVTLLFYSFQRLLYFTWNNHFFSETSTWEIFKAFVWGLRFDLFSVFVLAMPSTVLSWIPVPQRFLRLYLRFQLIIFFALQTPAYIINQIDVEFSNFAGRRFTLANLSILEEANNKITSYMITHGALIFAQLLILAALTIAFIKTAQWARETKSFRAPITTALIAAFLFPLSTLCIRGGLQRKPLSTAHANMFESSSLNNLMLNSTFTVLKGKSNHALKELQYFADKNTVKSYLNGANSDTSIFHDNLSRKKTNVVILILEGFALEYMGEVNQRSGFTPFLDQLAHKGLFFRNSYANARRSIEAIPSITSGIPTLMADAFVKSPYFENSLVGMGTYFKRIGYDTSFFHGGLPGTMYFDIYTKKAGFDHYYSAADYPDPRDSDGYWGIWDEEFLNFMSTTLENTPRPFLTTFFSLTSHHPYKVPKRYEKTLPVGDLPVLKTIAYTDMAVRKFFENIKDEPWYDNTLFIITADHTQVAYLDEYKNPLGRYRIPIIFYHPNYEFPKIDTNIITQQIDILPTLLDMFKIEGAKPLFGKSIFEPGSRYAVLLDDQNFYYRDANMCLVKKMAGEPKEFNCGKDTLFRAPVSIQSDADLATKRLQATLQYFQNAMIHNEIYSY